MDKAKKVVEGIGPALEAVDEKISEITGTDEKPLQEVAGEVKAAYGTAKDKVQETRKKIEKAHPKAAALGKEFAARVSKGKTLGDKVKDAAKWLGGKAIDFGSKVLLPSLPAFLSALCEEIFDKDEQIAAIRVLYLALATGAVDIAIDGSNYSYSRVVSNYVEVNSTVSYAVNSVKVDFHALDVAKSHASAVFTRAGTPPAWDVDEYVGFVPTFCVIEDHTVTSNQSETRCPPPSWIFHELVDEQKGIWYGFSAPSALRSLPRANQTVQPSLITKLLVAFGGQTSPVKVSTAPVLLKMMAMTVGEYPLPEQAERFNVPNYFVYFAQNDPSPEKFLDYWNLAPEHGPILPVVRGMFIDYNVFMQNANATVENNNQVLPPGFRPVDWEQNCAVVPVSTDMLNGATALQMWTLSHMEFPFETLAISGTGAVINNYDDPYTGPSDGPGNIYLKSFVWDTRLQGPRENVLFVVLDKFIDDPANSDLRLTLPSGLQLALGAAPVPIQDALQYDAAIPYSSQYQKSTEWWSKFYGNAADVRTANTMLAEMFGRKGSRFSEMRDTADGSWAMSAGFAVNTPGDIPGPRYQAPAGQAQFEPLTNEAVAETVSSWRSPTSRLGQNLTFTRASTPTHVMYGASAVTRLMIAGGYLLPMPEKMGGVVSSSNPLEFNLDRNIAHMLTRTAMLSEVMALMVDKANEQLGTTIKFAWPTNPWEFAGCFEWMQNNTHIVSHAGYTSWGVIPYGRLNADQFGFISRILPARRDKSMVASFTDTDMLTQKHLSLRKDVSPYLSMNIDLSYVRWFKKFVVADGVNVKTGVLAHELYQMMVKDDGSGHKVPVKVGDYDFLGKRGSMLASQTDRYLTPGGANNWGGKNDWVVGLGNDVGSDWQYSRIFYRPPSESIITWIFWEGQDDRPGILRPIVFQPPVSVQFPAQFPDDEGSWVITWLVLPNQIKNLGYRNTHLPQRVALTWSDVPTAVQAGSVNANTFSFSSVFGHGRGNLHTGDPE